MIILTSTFAQALAGSGPGVNIIGVVIVWRFIMGVSVGVGRDHPLSAVIASEFASTGSRGRLMTAVFTAQVWGNIGAQRHFYVEVNDAKPVLAASLVALITVYAYRDSVLTGNLNDLEHIDYCWRILIGMGCVPCAIALYFRLTIPETPRFAMDIDRHIQRARTDTVLGPNGGSAAVYSVRSRSVFINHFAQPGNLLLLFGAAYSWFAVDASPILYIG
jgi:MFS transporter, PHS family, inorganic phosphate transporter